MRLSTLVFGVLIATIAHAGQTFAQSEPAVPTEDDVARAEFLRGRQAYDSGQWGTALDAFERAYELSGRAQLLYNIGLSHDRLRHDEQALSYYERFLRSVENPPEETQVQARIRALRIALAEAEAEDAAREAEIVARLREGDGVAAESPEPEEPGLTFATSPTGTREDEEGGSNTPLIVGIIVGAVVVVAVTSVLIWNANQPPDIGNQEGDFGSHSTVLRFGP